ncbi:MAG: hypothetical protein AAB363_06680, partial [Planctomycetota bacterium]
MALKWLYLSFNFEQVEEKEEKLTMSEGGELYHKNCLTKGSTLVSSVLFLDSGLKISGMTAY